MILENWEFILVLKSAFMVVKGVAMVNEFIIV